MDILRVYVDSHAGSLNMTLSLYVALLVLLGLLALSVFRRRQRKTGEFHENVEYTIGPRECQVKFRPNNEDIQIAFKLYVELSTRKLGLPIDEKHDLVYEIYNSWYEFFKLTRELIKEIPIVKVRACDNCNNIIDVSINVLNECIRPHLNQWQAKFRHWYERELIDEGNKELSPQEIQQKYPEFQELMDDMKKVNADLIEYRAQLRELAYGKRQEPIGGRK